MLGHHHHLRHRPETSVLESTVLRPKSTELDLQFLARSLAKYTPVYGVGVSDYYEAPVLSDLFGLEPICIGGGFGNLNSGGEWILSFWSLWSANYIPKIEAIKPNIVVGKA